MELQKFLTKLDHIVVENGRRCGTDRVAIAIHRPGSIGGSPVVDVKDVEIVHIKDAKKGIDWDSRKIILTLEQEVSTLTPEQRDAITEDVKKGQSRESYEQFKAFKVKIAKLEALLKVTVPSHRALLEADENGTEGLLALDKMLAELVDTTVREK